MFDARYRMPLGTYKPLESSCRKNLLRMLLRTAFVAAMLAGSPSGVWAQTEAPPPRVARLIRLLGSRSYDQRAMAMEKLEKIGAAAREQLERQSGSPNPEVRARANTLLAKLRIAELWEPSRVTIRCRKKSAKDVLMQLARHSGNRVISGDPPFASFKSGRVNLDYTDRPFWAVVDAICRQSGNRIRSHYDQRKPGFVVVSGSLGKFPLAYAGPVRAKITAARRVFTEELDHETRESEITHNFQISLQLTWEDRFQLVAYRPQVEVIDAITDTQVEVAAIGSGCGEWNAATKTTREVAMSLSMQPPPTTAKQFDVLRLKWGLIAVGDMATLEVSDFESKEPHCQDDVKLVVQEMRKTGSSRFQMVLLVRRSFVVPQPRSVMFHENKIELVDSNGRLLRKMINDWRLTEAGLRIQATFRKGPANAEPTRLRFTYPRIRSQRDLEIVFRNVPLPSARPD